MKKINVSKHFNTVAAEVKEAYCDCNDLKAGNAVYIRRSLNFKASQPVSRDEAKVILEVAIPHGYNEFEPKLLKKFPKCATFQLARAGSVCIYVRANGGKLPSAKVVKADEKDVVGELVRYWWD